MTADQWTNLVSAVVPAITAYLAYRRAGTAVKKGDENQAAIQELHIVVNSRLSQLLEQTHLASRAEGAEDEREQQRTDKQTESKKET